MGGDKTTIPFSQGLAHKRADRLTITLRHLAFFPAGADGPYRLVYKGNIKHLLRAYLSRDYFPHLLGPQDFLHLILNYFFSQSGIKLLPILTDADNDLKARP